MFCCESMVFDRNLTFGESIVLVKTWFLVKTCFFFVKTVFFVNTWVLVKTWFLVKTKILVKKSSLVWSGLVTHLIDCPSLERGRTSRTGYYRTERTTTKDYRVFFGAIPHIEASIRDGLIIY